MKMRMNNITDLRGKSAEHVWVVRKPYNRNYYSIGHPSQCPAVMSFVDKRQASVFLKMVRQMDRGERARRPYDKTIVESMPIEYLKRACTMSSLDLCVVYKDGDVERLKLGGCFDHTEMVFHLENSFKYGAEF